MPFPILAFIVIPIAELLLLFEVADLIGGLATLGLVIVTAFVGVNVLRIQGFSTLSRANRRMAGGELPGQEIVEGLLLAFAGAARRLRLSTVGFLMYINPTIQFLIALLVFSEPLSTEKLTSFVMIWVALGLYSWSAWVERAKPVPS